MDRATFRLMHRLRVRWPEVDAQRVVFNGQYLAYFDVANSGYWRAIAFPYPEAFACAGGDTFVKKATLEYHAPAGYDDFVDAGMKCARLGTTSMTFAAAFFRDETLLATAEVVYVLVDLESRRPMPIPADIRAAIEAFEAGELVLRPVVGSWAERGRDVGVLRPEEAEDAGALHIVLHDRRGTPVATARLVEEAGAGLVEGVFVRREMRGGGFGRTLVEALADTARERGLRSLAVRPPRAEAGFFERIGFRASLGDQSLKRSW